MSNSQFNFDDIFFSKACGDNNTNRPGVTAPPQLQLTQAFQGTHSTQEQQDELISQVIQKPQKVEQCTKTASRVGVVNPTPVNSSNGGRRTRPLFKPPFSQQISEDFPLFSQFISTHPVRVKDVVPTAQEQQVQQGVRQNVPPAVNVNRNNRKTFRSGSLEDNQLPCTQAMLEISVPQYDSSSALESEQGTTLRLKSISCVPPEYQPLFDFPYFNTVQSKVYDDVFHSDRSVVLCAPTGSGKTVIFELAIIRMLMRGNKTSDKAVYMAPIKALCSERFDDWQNKFSRYGISCMELTGDTEIDDYYDLHRAQLIFTTPEKWDSMTRCWRDNVTLVRSIRLFMIDEVHVLNDQTRGATMEVVISRMKTVQSVLSHEGDTTTLRFVAVSATVPNVQDVADWLTTGTEKPAAFRMDDSLRPVRLRKVVIGYPCSDQVSGFRFDMTLSYKVAGLISTYSESKPTLVFCATRKSVQQSAAILVKEAKFIVGGQRKQTLQVTVNNLKDSKLRELVLNGVGYHHAGLDVQDRRIIENIFSHGELPVLMATSTLAMGVNLPAHLVIVKSTEHYVMGCNQEYDESQILQMIGRAGRPQFDTSATAVIMTRNVTKQKYDSLLNGTQLIESSLHQNLPEHVNAEVVLKTITDISVALKWIRDSFLYIRVLKNPKHYNIPADLPTAEVEKRLQDLCLKSLNDLAAVDLVRIDEDGFTLSPTDTGVLMARYCVAYETMKNLHQLRGTEALEDLLILVCSSQEFGDITLRVNEKKTLNTLNMSKNTEIIRFPMAGKVRSSHMKVNCLIQCTLGSLPLQEFTLQQDVNKIFRGGLRVLKCLVEMLWHRDRYTAFLNSVLLCKCFKSRLWENSKHMCKQLTGVGQMTSNALVNAGIINFQKLENTNPRELELMANRHPPFGQQLREAVQHLPKYDVCIEQSNNLSSEHSELTISMTISNMELIREKCTLSPKHSSLLIIGNADNRIILRSRISDAVILRDNVWSTRLKVIRCPGGDELAVNLISQEWVGLDIMSSYTPQYSRHRVTQPQPVLPHRNQELAAIDKPCGHRCNDKLICAHECCKVGVKVGVKRPPLRKSSISNIRSELKHKIQTIGMNEDTVVTLKRRRVTPDLNHFKYTGRNRLQYSLGPNQLPDIHEDEGHDLEQPVWDLAWSLDLDPGSSDLWADDDGTDDDVLLESVNMVESSLPSGQVVGSDGMTGYPDDEDIVAGFDAYGRWSVYKMPTEVREDFQNNTTSQMSRQPYQPKVKAVLPSTSTLSPMAAGSTGQKPAAIENNSSFNRPSSQQQPSSAQGSRNPQRVVRNSPRERVRCINTPAFTFHGTLANSGYQRDRAEFRNGNGATPAIGKQELPSKSTFAGPASSYSTPVWGESYSTPVWGEDDGSGCSQELSTDTAENMSQCMSPVLSQEHRINPVETRSREQSAQEKARNTHQGQGHEPRATSTDQGPEQRVRTDQGPEQRSMRTDQGPEQRVRTDQGPEQRFMRTDQDPEQRSMSTNQGPLKTCPKSDWSKPGAESHSLVTVAKTDWSKPDAESDWLKTKPQGDWPTSSDDPHPVKCGLKLDWVKAGLEPPCVTSGKSTADTNYNKYMLKVNSEYQEINPKSLAEKSTGIATENATGLNQSRVSLGTTAVLLGNTPIKERTLNEDIAGQQSATTDVTVARNVMTGSQVCHTKGKDDSRPQVHGTQPITVRSSVFAINARDDEDDVDVFAGML